ncbi:LamB/YcsF family protein [Microbacterium halophytorum]|uniref:LamB/YcsF family protein n=1 Tax=Microbacterium halophytorum TaxID=2067568 RepID=UPI000CFA9B6B|nr:5-oxoprolinase subunit PxpA [Microbacterium halophytorum]
MTRRIDLVADLGEGFGDWKMGDDEAMLDVLSSANIACGFHAGDPRIMDATVASCARRGIAIGAHPSFPDLGGFGRRAMDLTAHEVRTDATYQLGALAGFAAHHGTRVTHIAPHGRLGNLVAVRHDYADAIVETVLGFDDSLTVMAQDGELAAAARAAGLRVGIVGIVDRAYRADGTLVPRSEPGAVIHDPAEVADRSVRLVLEGKLTSVDGVDLEITADTLLMHGDNPAAVALSREVRARLEAAGVVIAPFSTEAAR